MKQFLYKLFYSPSINLLVRSILKIFKKIIPNSLKIPVSGIIKVKVGNGKNIKFFTNETSPMTKILFWESEECSFEYSLIFKDIIKDCKVFFDIGANVGYYTLLSKAINNDLDVYSIEPSNGPKYFLKENLRINDFTDVKFIEKAVGDKIGKITFYEEKNPKYKYQKYHASGIGNTANTWGIENYLKYDVELTNINQICNEYKVSQIDLIKIDTEGTEDLVLLGGIEILKLHQPIIICEVLKNKIEDKIDYIVNDKLDYLIFQFITEKNKLRQIPHIKGENENDETNYFFVPKTKVNLIEKFILKE